MPRPSAASAPSVEIRASEVQLAVRSVLLGRDRLLSRELPKRVTVDSEVVRRVAGVEPLAMPVVFARRVSIDQSCESLDDALHELVDYRTSIELPALTSSVRACLISLGAVRLVARLSLGVSYAAIVVTSS
jgi:hypothetical protein